MARADWRSWLIGGLDLGPFRGRAYSGTDPARQRGSRLDAGERRAS
jgi:hypothetical protein